jgi:hypothetical protein
VAIVVIVVIVALVVVADYEINPDVAYTVSGLACFRTGRFQSGDSRKLEQTAVCFLKYIDTIAVDGISREQTVWAQEQLSGFLHRRRYDVSLCDYHE